MGVLVNYCCITNHKHLFCPHICRQLILVGLDQESSATCVSHPPPETMDLLGHVLVGAGDGRDTRQAQVHKRFPNLQPHHIHRHQGKPHGQSQGPGNQTGVLRVLNQKPFGWFAAGRPYVHKTHRDFLTLPSYLSIMGHD